MERIQEAIEKAKRERQGRIGSGNDREMDPPLVNAQSVDAPTTVEPKLQGKGSPGNSIRVSYSETRSVDLDEENMKEKRIVAGFSHDSRSEPYRQLRGQILKRFRANNWQTLAVTSPSSNAGSTLTAVNLAISLSLETNQTVMLVDLNLRNPSVASCLGLGDIEKGIVDYMQGEAQLGDILVNPGYERLVVLPGAPRSGFTSEILSSPEMGKVITELVSRYPSRIIIFDLPGVLEQDDALVFAPTCDGTLMVIEEGGTKSSHLERAYQLLEGCEIVGTVLNKVRYL